MSTAAAEKVRAVPVRPRAAGRSVMVGVVAAVFSALSSWVPSYWADEIASVQAARMRPWELWSFIQQKDAVHALYDLLLHGWIAVVGESEFATRALSALAVGAAAAGLVLIGTRLATPAVGVTAGLLFALLPRTTYIGAETRSSALATALVVWGVIALLVALRRRSWRWWALYAGMLTLTAYVFLDTLLMLLVHAAFVVAGSDRRRMSVRWLLAVAAALALTVPLLRVAFAQRDQIAWIAGEDAVSPWSILVEPWFESSLPSVLVALALLVTATIRRRILLARCGTSALVLAAAWAFLPSAALLAADLVAGPVYLARYLAFATPGMALLLALAATALPWRRGAVIVVIAMLLAGMTTYLAQRTPFAKGGGSDLRKVAQYIHDHASRGDAVLLDNTGQRTLRPRQAIDGYPTLFRGLDDIAFVRTGARAGSFSDVTRPARTIDWSGVHKVWVAIPLTGPEAGRLDRALTRAGFDHRAPAAFHRTEVIEYSRAAPVAP